MFCQRLILVNWGNIPPIELELGPINLFSGGNGSGKTTAADALQSLMTAAHENLFNFNPGQDETTQRGRGGKQVRTLASYVLGCDDGSYARLQTTDGYIVGVFHPTQGEVAEPFSAIMGVRASLETAGAQRQARQEELQFLIVPDALLGLDDFICDDTLGKQVVPITRIADELARKVGGRQRVEVYDKKGPYLRRLYGIFRGESTASDREAKHAARTFSNFMAYKPVKSITEFVAREILEPKDMTDDIRQVGDLMKTIYAMEEETRHVNQAVANLSSALNHSQTYIDAWIHGSVLSLAEKMRSLRLKKDEENRLHLEQASLLNALKENRLQNELLTDRQDALQQEQVEMLAQRQGIISLRTKDQLTNELLRLKAKLADALAELTQQNAQFTKNLDAATQLDSALSQAPSEWDFTGCSSKKMRTLLAPILAAGNDSGLDSRLLQTQDWIDNSALDATFERIVALEAQHNRVADWLHGGEKSLYSQLYLQWHRKVESSEKLRQQWQQKNTEVQRLGQARVTYPQPVEQALQAIKAQYPEAEPAVLCDFIDIVDPDWQMAIEGYLGGARFGIVVHSDYEAQAISLVRQLPGRRNAARVVQGAKAQRDAGLLTLPDNSILHQMRFEHKVVEYAIKASYGTVECVKNAEILKKTARGLTKEGLGSGNYSLFRCDLDEADLVFGRSARERALKAREDQLQSLQVAAQDAERQALFWEKLYRQFSQVAAVSCSSSISALLNVYRPLQKCEQQLSQLDCDDHSALDTQLQSLKQRLKTVSEAMQQCSEQHGSLRAREEQNSRVAKRVSDEVEQAQVQQHLALTQLQALVTIYPDLELEQALSEAASVSEQVSDYVEALAAVAQKLDLSERRLYERLLDHNRQSAQYAAVTYAPQYDVKHDVHFLKSVVALQSDIQRIHNLLKNNLLIGKHEKLLTLKDSFSTTFVSSLCHSIYQAINDGKRALDELNQELEHHHFGADKERFYFDYEWIPEFKEYWDFFKDVISSPSLGDGASLFDAELSGTSLAVRDKLLSMLLDKDEQAALNQLRRISDYRNYRRYEIYKQPQGKQPIPLSTYGTGSGGQLETPAYIIRAAAITAAFRFNDGQSHCRLVLVDEAFSKMDETRSREVIHYLTHTLGLQLIFIMPSSKSGPFMDLISHQVVFTKCPTTEGVGELQTRVLVDRKVCNQDKIKALWAQHRRTLREQVSLDFMEGLI
jgi:energy-coupling factor transporter ATP-binding protein EcfA2